MSWLPGWGWLSVALGVGGCTLGTLSITRWHAKPGYTAWGISGLFLGITAFDLGLAYQIKHAHGVLDFLYREISPPMAVAVMACGAGFVAAGLVAARGKHRAAGLALAAVFLLLVALSGTWWILTEDRAFTGWAAHR